MEYNLIIGAATGYNYNQLKPWVESIGKVCDEYTDKVLFVGNMSEETRTKLIEQNFLLIEMPNVPGVPVHVARFLAIYDYLRDSHRQYKYVVTTDVKDVYFQTNPFNWIDKVIFPGSMCRLVVGSESMLYKDEPWGNENLLQAYGPYVHSTFKENKIYNVGVIGGHSEYVKDLVFNIFTNAINRPIPIVDQAVFNVLIQTKPYKDVIYFAEQSDGWACQAGTTADPSKIEQFRPFLTEAEPIFENGAVLTSKRKPFCIVHQYDRVPEWKKFIQAKYKQEDPNNFFTYRTT